jgi:hypothetical protein
MVLLIIDSHREERPMDSMTASGIRGVLMRTAVAAAVAGVAVLGATVPANASPAVRDDPGCDVFGWRHPLCAGGAFESPPDDGVPGDDAAEGGIPAPAMVPNVDGSLSLPGTPGAI